MYVMIGWVGDPMENSSTGLFADADYAGCGESLKPTSGAHLHIIQGVHTAIQMYNYVCVYINTYCIA